MHKCAIQNLNDPYIYVCIYIHRIYWTVHMSCEYIMMCPPKKEKTNGIRYLKKITKYRIIKKNIPINLCDLTPFLNHFLYSLPCTLSTVCPLTPFPASLVAEHTYTPASPLTAPVMVSDGVLMEPPLYRGSAVTLRVVDTPLAMRCHSILFWNGLELTTHPRVTVPP